MLSSFGLLFWSTDWISIHFVIKLLEKKETFPLWQLRCASLPTVCSGPTEVVFDENNKVDDVVANLTVQSGVTLELTPPSNNLFTLRGNQLLAAIVFDYEVLQIMTKSAIKFQTHASVYILNPVKDTDS